MLVSEDYSCVITALAETAYNPVDNETPLGKSIPITQWVFKFLLLLSAGGTKRSGKRTFLRGYELFLFAACELSLRPFPDATQLAFPYPGLHWFQAVALQAEKEMFYFPATGKHINREWYKAPTDWMRFLLGHYHSYHLKLRKENNVAPMEWTL